MEDYKEFILNNNLLLLDTFKKNGNKTGTGTSFYNKNKEIFEAILSKHKTSNMVEAFMNELNLVTKKKCLICGNPTKFSERNKEYMDCCSKKCQSKSSNAKREQTNIEKYGVSHPMKSDDIKKKQKDTNISTYGVNNVFQIDEIKQKSKRTMEEKYNVEYTFQSPILREKAKKTYMDNYGVDHPMKSYKIKKKKEMTLIEKYGSPTHQPIKNIENLNASFILKNFVDANNFISISDVTEYYSCCRNFWVTKIKPLLPDYVNVKPTSKTQQLEIIKYIQSIYDGNVIIDDRNVLDGLELDIIIPEKNIAIEYNGLIWHSYGKSDYSKFNNLCNENKNYHLNKTLMCETKNINLLHIYEDEWLNPIKKDIWKSIIHTKLGLNKKIYARNCIVKELENEEYRDFCDVNHVQGHTNAKIKIGLYYKEELVSIMSFSRARYNKKCDWELIRSCSKKYLTVIGGFQKLLKYFTNQYEGDIISYANRNHSMGNVYRKAGFLEVDASPPNYRYFKPNSMEFISRQSAQKHKLKSKLKFFKEEFTEKENLINNDYRIIWDSGNLVFVYRNKENQ